ncbi:hypothetical protein D3C75_902060 [compost metagenome]
MQLQLLLGMHPLLVQGGHLRHKTLLITAFGFTCLTQLLQPVIILDQLHLHPLGLAPQLIQLADGVFDLYIQLLNLPLAPQKIGGLLL